MEGEIRELERDLERLGQLEKHLKDLATQRRQSLRAPAVMADRKAEKLHALKGVGEIGAVTLARDFLWRDFRNDKEVGAMAGLVGSPFQSGQMDREQGISKAGNARIRALMVEVAWGWLRHQPQSELSQWFWRRCEAGDKRAKRKWIVALARKLLVALWRYVERGIPPTGAVLRVGCKAA
jgi:transposase